VTIPAIPTTKKTHPGEIGKFSIAALIQHNILSWIGSAAKSHFGKLPGGLEALYPRRVYRHHFIAAISSQDFGIHENRSLPFGDDLDPFALPAYLAGVLQKVDAREVVIGERPEELE
jgi:hypothetical protein